MSALGALRDEDERRGSIRAAVAAVFAVGGETSMVVRRVEVYETVREALDMRIMPPWFQLEIAEIVEGMGAVPIRVGHARLFAAVRRHTVEVKVAREESAALRKRLRGGKGNKGKEGKEGKDETTREWENKLEAEGMPAELPMIARPRRRGKAGSRFEQDSATFEAPALVTGGSGVHRQPSTTGAEIRGGAAAAAAQLLSDVEDERAVLRLRAEGLSLRKIGIRLDLDKMAVSRVLSRIAART